MSKQETLKVFVPLLKKFDTASTTNDYLNVIQSVINEFASWEYPSDREVETFLALKAIRETLDEIAILKMKKVSGIDLQEVSSRLSFLINALYDLVH